MADQGERDKINTKTNEIASTGAHNGGWNIVRLRSSYKLVNLSHKLETHFCQGGLRKQVWGNSDLASSVFMEYDSSPLAGTLSLLKSEFWSM
jgi:hypothetical protein